MSPGEKDSSGNWSNRGNPGCADILALANHPDQPQDQLLSLPGSPTSRSQVIVAVFSQQLRKNLINSLKFLYTYTMQFAIYLAQLSSNSSQCSICSLPPNFIFCVLFRFRSPVSVVHMHIGVEPYTDVWASLPQLCPQRKVTLHTSVRDF